MKELDNPSLQYRGEDNNEILNAYLAMKQQLTMIIFCMNITWCY